MKHLALSVAVTVSQKLMSDEDCASLPIILIRAVEQQYQLYSDCLYDEILCYEH